MSPVYQQKENTDVLHLDAAVSAVVEVTARSAVTQSSDTVRRPPSTFLGRNGSARAGNQFRVDHAPSDPCNAKVAEAADRLADKGGTVFRRMRPH